MRLHSPRVGNIEDLRRLARRRLPTVVFDYLEGGAEGEVTRRALEILRADMERTLQLPGCPAVTQLDRSFVDAPA